MRPSEQAVGLVKYHKLRKKKVVLGAFSDKSYFG